MQPIPLESAAETLYRSYGIRATGLTRLVGGVMNVNVRVETSERAYVLRIYPQKNESDTELERYMLHTLATQNFPCPNPLRTKDGHDSIEIEGYPAILYPLIEGSQPIVATRELLKELGRYQGRLHQAFLGQSSPYSKKGWDPADLQSLILEQRAQFVASDYPDADSFLNFIESELMQCHFPSDLPRGLTHQDIKPENVLVKDGHVTGILDFDNAYEGALLHDITTTLIWWCFPNGVISHELIGAFLVGYESMRPLQKSESDLLLKDGLRFRLLRELFIGPMTTLSNLPLATERAHVFQQIYRRYFKSTE